jgi:photosystem II stability/assembly factor-like uncharacterized protein
VLVVAGFGHHSHRLGAPLFGIGDGESSFTLAGLSAGPKGLYALLNDEDAPFASKEAAERGGRHAAGHLFRSVDEARTWVELGRLDTLTRGALRDLIISGSQLWVENQRSDWLSSADEGATWRVFSGWPRLASLVAGTPSTLLLRVPVFDANSLRSSANLLLRSADAGSTWQTLSDVPNFGQLAAGGNGDWSAVKSEQFFRSLDDGLHWRPEAIVTATDPVAAQCLAEETVNWSVARLPDEGYAFGFVSPGKHLHRSTDGATKGVRLFAQGAPSVPSITAR